MKLGACDYVVRRGDDVATFAYARRLGLSGVEFFIDRKSLREAAATRLKRIKQAAQATGMEVPSLCMVEHNSGGMGSENPAVATAARDDIRAAIGWCAELGAKVILVPFFFGGELPTQAAFDRAVQGFRQLCPIAAAKGVALCYEGTLPAARIREMAARVESDAFGCYFDLANVVWRGMDSPTEIRALGKLIRQVHIKDSRVGPGDCQPGTGRVDYPESARALAEVGYDGWMVMETPGGVGNGRDVAFARTTFPGLRGGIQWPVFGTVSHESKRGQLDAMIGAYHQAGLSAVHLAGEILDECVANPAKAAVYSEKLEHNATTVVGLAGYKNIAALDPVRRKANIDYLARCLEIAPAFVNPVVATETGTLHPTSEWTAVPENWDAPAWNAVYAALDRLLPVAEKNGSVLALEVYVNNIVQTVGQVIGLFEKYPTPRLQLVLDPYNYISSHLLPAVGRVASDLFNRFEPKFAIAHLKDVGAEGAEKDTPAFGKGVFPQKMYIDFLRTRRPDLPVILEHLPFGDIPEAIRKFKQMAGV